MFIKSTTDKNKILKTQTYKPGMRLPVFNAHALLANRQHQFLIERLSELSLLNVEQHEELYTVFIHRFAEFVQVLPKKVDESLCGLMNEGLMRGINVLHQFLTTHADTTPLERYAIFTAAVLMDVAAVMTNQKIFITDEEGNFVRHWEPFMGALTEDSEAEYYKMMPLGTYYQRNSQAITALIAQQVLPRKGFLWLASDAKIFADWLDALLANEGEGTGRFTHTVQLFKHNALEGLISSLPAVNVVQEESPATTHADAFMAWLKEGLTTKQIKVNTSDAGVHVTAQGVFLDKPAIFKQFIDLYNVPVNMFSVFQQFGNLFGLTKLSGADYRIAQLFSEYPDTANKFKVGFTAPLASHQKTIREGVMISDPHLVFMHEVPEITPHLKPMANEKPPQKLPPISNDSKLDIKPS